MFTKNPITAVSKSGAIKTTAAGGQGHQVTANIGSTGFGPKTNGHINVYAASQYNYMMSGLLPAEPNLPDSSQLQYFYRDIYLHDNTAGSVVDTLSVFPFSDWELRGLETPEQQIYDDALARLSLQELLPQASIAYLTDGFYCGSLVFDADAKNFMDILTHDALQCGVSPSPFNNVDPTVQVSVSGPTLRFLDSATDYAKAYIKTMPSAFIDLLKEGSFVCDPVTTIFMGRRTLTDRAYTSFLHRILPMYLIEKTMFRGTLTEATRRQRAMSHIQAGDDTWTPTGEELGALTQMFTDAERDPLGGWISTRNAINVQDLRPGGDFWKWTDMVDIMVAYKLRALCASEALLSGDASYAAAESAYSSFLETTNAYRTRLTNDFFYKKLFPLIAIANRLFKDPSKQKRTDSLVDFLFNSSNRANLKTPTLHWHKDLTAKSEDNMMDMLEKVEAHGVPIPIKMWLAAAGVDKETLIRDGREDKAIREALIKSGMKMPQSQNQDGGMGMGNEADDEFGAPTDASGATYGQQDDASMIDQSNGDPRQGDIVTSRSIHSGDRGFAKGILAREFGDPKDFTYTITGQKKYTMWNRDGKAKDQNWRIAQIARRVDLDPNYRAELAKGNAKRFGSSVMNIGV